MLMILVVEKFPPKSFSCGACTSQTCALEKHWEPRELMAPNKSFYALQCLKMFLPLNMNVLSFTPV